MIPKSKIFILKNKIIEECDTCKSLKRASCEKCNILSKLNDRYVDANIPVSLFDKTMNDFDGDEGLLSMYLLITKDLKKSFMEGTSYFFRGLHGVGKTMVSVMILKKVVEKGMSGLYTTLGDVVQVMVHGDRDSRMNGSRELKMVDWLVIDEFDSRFMGSDSSAELFGRILEGIIRIRFHNMLPTILITNSMNPTKTLGDKTLGDKLDASISSLISGHCVDVPVAGADYRKKGN